MRPRPVSTRRPLALLGLLCFVSSACTDEKIVYREPFNPPPDAESGFVGYFSSSDKSTTCGNCHVDHQNKWIGTAHGDAYAGLVNSGGAQDFCYGCHTVSQNGNQVSGAAGWNVVQDTAYHDVQCESCHGPGVDHIETPDANAPPLARVRPTSQPETSITTRPPCPAPVRSATAAPITRSSMSGEPRATPGP
jgi:hypothetical protein